MTGRRRAAAATRGPLLGFPRGGSENRAAAAAPGAAARAATEESGVAERHAPCSARRVVNRAPATFAIAALLALLGPGLARAAPADERSAAQAELDALAPRIERLKREASAGQDAGAELLRLLARAQALAALLERPLPAPPAPPAGPLGPDAQELRERADAVRDRADKAAAALAEVERRLAELLRRAELAERLEALSATADLFADGATGRAAAGAARAGDGGSPAAPGAGPVAATGGPAAPSSRSAAEPGSGRGLPDGEDAGTLRRRQAEMRRAFAALQAEADVLDAEARAAEGR